MKAETELTKEISQEEMNGYEAKAIEIAKKIGAKKVHVYIGLDPETNERVIGYLKEPNYLQKLYAMDKISSVGPFTAGDELRQAITLTEESDTRTYGASSDCDEYKLGMTGRCIAMINVANDNFKKK